MTDSELMQEALESIEWLRLHLERDHGCLHMKPAVSGISDWLNKTEASLRARLSICDRCGKVNPAELHTCTPPEPVAWTPVEIDVDVTSAGTHVVGMYVLMPDVVRHVFYSQFHPAPQREWVGLTDEEMMQIYVALKSVAGFYSIEKYARAIEVNLKEKNT